MIPEQKRTAIAEACGWKIEPTQVRGGWKLYCGDIATSFWWVGESIPTLLDVVHQLPDYLNDLNAMHEAEKVLRNQFTTLEETYWRNLSHVQPHPIYATASQRADAFLKTIEKL